MKCLSKLYELLDKYDEPRCSKTLLKQIFRRSGKFKMSPSALRNGTDSGPLVRHGLIKQSKNGTVGLTKKAREMID